MGKVTSKGQVTIPKRVRDALGLGPGANVLIESQGDLAVIRPAKKPAKSDFVKRLEKVRGTLKSDMTTDEIMELMRGE